MTLVDASPTRSSSPRARSPLLQRVPGPRKPALVGRTDVANVYGAQLPRIVWRELVDDAVGQGRHHPR